MKILITGNMGYVGPEVAKYLRVSRPDAILHGLDNAAFGAVFHDENLEQTLCVGEKLARSPVLRTYFYSRAPRFACVSAQIQLVDSTGRSLPLPAAAAAGARVLIAPI